MMKRSLLFSLWIGLCAARPHSEICRQLEDGVVPENAELKDINECYECDDWHRMNLPSPGENDMAPPGLSEGVVRCQDPSGQGIRIPLGRLIKVGGIEISREGDQAWIADFTMTYVDSSGNEKSIKDRSGDLVFAENSDASTTKERKFLMPVEASELRIKSTYHRTEACARIGVFACDAEEEDEEEEGDEIEGGGMGQDPPMPNADGYQRSFNSLREFFRKLYCSTRIERDCFGKCVTYKRNVFGCITCECRVARRGEKIEGDILATEETTEAFKDAMGIGQQQRGASSNKGRWPKQGQYYIVPYQLNGFSSSSTTGRGISQAIADFNRLTCIRLTPRRGQQAHINFIIGSGCYSPVGMQSRGNTVSIGRGCESKGIVIHEIMHSLGFWHEQSRPDRDNYVEIRFQNISPNLRYNFQKRQASGINSFGSRYDVGSVMHYGGYAFSSNRRPTIVLRNTNTPVTGQRAAMAASDIFQINKMYPCNKNPGSTTTSSTVTTRTTTTTTPSPGCRDRLRNCGRYLPRNCCSSRSMKYWCSATCRHC